MKQSLQINEQQDSHKAAWYRALSLTERANLLPRHESEESITASESQLEIAHKRLHRWKRQPPFPNASYFEQRLASDALTEQELLFLLAESPEQLQKRLAETISLPWLNTLIDTFKLYMSEQAPLQIYKPQERPNNAVAFLETVEPLINSGLMRLQAGIRELSQMYTHMPFEPDKVIPLLLSHIPDRLLPKMVKTMVLELHIARLQGRLQGETAEKRFQDFIQQLNQPQNMLQLLEEYTVLARLLVESIDMWVDYGLELLTRLCDDWPEILATFSPQHDPGTLTEILAGQGDTHRRGRSVVVLVWSSGFRLVYKPRSLAIDAHFQELLTWLNQHGYQPGFRTTKFVQKAAHGWTEFIAPQPCTSLEQVQRFYERQGGYLALLHALAATDFHAENIIAAGEHPVLIDLEALFHPYLVKEIERQKQSPAIRALDYSVLRIGLLPQRIWSSEQGEGIDVSGLGGAAGQMTPTPVARWADIGTDTMQMRLEHVAVRLGDHRPTLDEQDIDTNTFRATICAGFRTVYQLLRQHRQELLTEVLPRFAHDEIRCLIRPTGYYGILVNNSFHPDVLRDALDRDCFFDRLWINVEQDAQLAHVIPQERLDLLRADIPLFTTRPNSLDLISSQGEIIADFFEDTGMNAAIRHLQSFDDQNLARQEWLINAAFASITPVKDRQVQRSIRFDPSSRATTTEDCLALAREIGDRLIATAFHSDEIVEWLELAQLGEQEWQVVFTDADLYNGSAGIALFLAYLGKQTGAEQYTTLARKALTATRIKVHMHIVQGDDYGLGAFIGLGSFIYLLTQLGTLWQDEQLHVEAEQLIQQLSPVIARETVFDVNGGVAGCLLTLLSLYKVKPTQTILQIALECGEHLLAHMRSTPEGKGWSPTDNQVPLTGFAHGNAGIALSLFQLYAISGEQRFLATAREAVAYETAHYSPERKNWRNLRKQRLATTQIQTPSSQDEEEAAYMVAWCHGAAGIALARLGSLEADPLDAIYSDITAALETTLEQGFGANHSLCHGDLGNLDILLSADQMLATDKYQADIQRLSAMLLQSIREQGWITGVPQGIETPGLMTGLAGIGYALLRLAAPTQIPSVLLLAPPAKN
ncbi:type 2 lanthipeptide synthetase LanM family protein [Dictyobacter formicarum]|uniref:Lanthionine synthetase n=1 Tax=Dictyobacter formicarum TaxID=2778368 RepID=A0ABQ3V8A1_9CHLR|nr:type 2 lanthipeptide synthetase LanM family protein [Dictyobacter formicarum]GHO82069.1 lanthionine synthetase [Dictyobacter formicarum]